MFLYIVLFLTFYILVNNFLHKIKNLPPSPFPSLPIIGHLYLIFKKPLHRTLSKLSTKHGPILLLNFGCRRVVLLSSPSAVKECFTTNDVVFANRPRILLGQHLGYNSTSLPWAPYGNHWKNLRKISSLEILSTTRLHALSSLCMEEVRSLICILIHTDDQNQMVDMKSAFFKLTVNVIMRMASGKRFFGEDEAGAKKIVEIMTETVRIGGGANALDVLPVLKWLGFGGIENKFRTLQKKRDGFMHDLLRERRRQTAQIETTMIDVMLSFQESDPQIFNDEVIRSLILVFLTAGTDTAVNTMEWAMSLLLNNPYKLKKAQTEMESQIGFDRLIDESDLANLHYLHCIILETLRLYPPGPFLIPHESSEECMLGGFRVPRGTMLLVNMWAIQNDPIIWEDAKEFKPERFEGIEGARDGFQFMPFGYGRRSCPGEGLATRVIGLTLGSLIQCFEWERASDDQEMVDMTEGSGFVLPKIQPLQAKCRPRPPMLKLLSQISTNYD